MTSEAISDLGRAQVEGLLLPYTVARGELKILARDVEGLARIIKPWLESHPEETLYDGEHGITARLQQRAAPGRDCDLNSMYDGSRGLFEQLLRNGCLRVDEEAIKRAGALVGGVGRYLGPKGVTTALIVEQEDKR